MPPDPLPASIPTEGPCHPWTDITTVRERCAATDTTTIDDTAIEFAVDLASLVLWNATGRRYGLCLRTVRPCWTGCPEWRRCSCWLPEIYLRAPIAAVDEVMVNGVALAATAYRIQTVGPDARRTLVRVDGEPWPCCNDLELDPTVVPVGTQYCDAWYVRYWQGRAVPTLGVTAASLLAEQIARQYCTTAGCDDNMTANLKRVSRRGVTKEYDANVDRDDKTGRIRTGIKPVDDWILAVNPHGRVRQPAIIRPDDPWRHNLWQLIDAA